MLLLSRGEEQWQFQLQQAQQAHHARSGWTHTDPAGSTICHVAFCECRLLFAAWASAPSSAHQVRISRPHRMAVRATGSWMRLRALLSL